MALTDSMLTRTPFAQPVSILSKMSLSTAQIHYLGFARGERLPYTLISILIMRLSFAIIRSRLSIIVAVIRHWPVAPDQPDDWLRLRGFSGPLPLEILHNS